MTLAHDRPLRDDLLVRAAAEHVGGLARAVAPEGRRAVADAIASAGWTLAGAGSQVIDCELTLPLRAERVGEAVARVAYLVATAAAPPVIVHGVATTDEAALHAFTAAGPDGVVRVNDLDLVLRRFPDDPALPWLSGLPGAGALDGLPAPVVEPRSLTDAVVRYRPGRRVIVRLEPADGGTALYAKVHAGGRDVHAMDHLRSVAASAPRFPACEVVAHGPATGTVWTADAGGVPLAELLTGPDAGALVAEAAAGLALLHAADVDAPPDVPLDRAVPEAERRARRLAAADPASHGALDAAMARIRADAPTSIDIVTRYGDFHHEQIRSTEHGLVFLDLDSLRRGAPEADLAEFAAHLLATLGAHDGRTIELAMTMVDGYAAATGRAPDARALRWYLRIELLQRAFGALKTLRPGWQDEARALIELAAGEAPGAIVPASMVRRRPR